MAENKKSFLLYCDLIHTVSKMPKDKAGELFVHILEYVNDMEPLTEDLIIQLTFEPIKQSLKRDLDKWEAQLEQRRQAGIRSAEVRKQNATSVNERSISSTVNVSVSDSVITSNEIIEIDVAVAECLKDENWKSEVERIYKVDRNKIKFALSEFKSHCVTTKEDKPRSLKKFCQHFTNWVRVKKQYQKTG